MKPAFAPTTIALLFIAVLSTSLSFSQTTFLAPTGVSWKYLNNGTDQGTTWKDVGFNDSGWPSGNTEFGYPTGYTTNLTGSPMTTYFRKTFTVTGLSNYTSWAINYYRNDGVLIYINGVEINSGSRDNMPAGAVTYTTSASTRLNNGQTSTQQNITGLSTSLLVEGTNTIAIELHQFNSAQGLADARFQLGITGTLAPTLSIDRGPYIMMVNETEATIRWRTNTASDSRVQLGTTAGVYTIIKDSVPSTTQHIVRVTGLTPDTRYYYSVGSTGNPTLGGNASDYYFNTAPQQNTTRKLKFAVFGDCGRNDNSFRTQSIASYNNHVGSNKADALLLLGDNAYTNGTEAEYNTGFFQPMSSTMLKNHVLFPAPGNHDYYSSSQSVRTGQYYVSFTTPQTGECGGVPSNAPGYYSWNWGDVHFLSLDSYGTETGSAFRLWDTTGPQVNWIKADLAANTRKWVVAYWHHPPYTMGSHTSNTETDLINIRYNFIRILERMGVDLILCGHSHDYERSKLMDGHYGTEVSTAAMTPFLKSNTSGMYDGSANSCVYTTQSGTGNHGTVYVVAGSSGADGGVNAGLDGYPHNALPYSIDDGGMLYLEVEGNRLDAKFLRRDNSIGDRFTIMQDVNKTTNLTITAGNSVNLTASWPGSYVWSTGPTTQTINVTPPIGTTNYTVTDQYGCITDQFNVTANATLPVTITNYSVSLRNDQVYVLWTTSEEINNRDFTIERSANGREFTGIGVVAGAGNSSSETNYQFIDPTPLEGTSYYRLLQTNNDRVGKYYPVKRIMTRKNSSFYADAYRSGTQSVSMQVFTANAEKIQLNVYDISGQLVKAESWALNAGSNNKVIELRNGTYVLEWKKADGTSLTQKIVIQ